MIRIDDLHADDAAARDRIASHLRDARRAAGMLQRDVAAALGITHTAVSHMERSRSWQARAVQRWARALDLRLVWHTRGLPVPDDGDPLAAVYAAAHPPDADAVDRHALRCLVHDLSRIRRWKGWVRDDMGVRLGISGSAVSSWENHPDRTLLVTVQRYARGLGGSLWLGLEPADVPAAAR